MIDSIIGGRASESWQLYVPVLRAKASEWDALEALETGVRQRILPIIEFVPEWKGPSAGNGKRKPRSPQTPGAYIDALLNQAVRQTPAGTKSFVDFGHAGSAASWQGVDLWASFVARVPATQGVMPLVDLSRVAGSAGSLLSAVRHVGDVVGLRVRGSDVGPALSQVITTALNNLHVSRQAAHLIVDLAGRPDALPHRDLRVYLNAIADYASITVLAGVFPRDLSQYGADRVHSVPRREWEEWLQNHRATPDGERQFGYGDYPIQCASYAPSPEQRGSVSLRYTTDDAVMIFRGRQTNKAAGITTRQIHGHCRLLVAQPYYNGAAFSHGDQRFHCWCNPNGGRGRPQDWRAAGLAHHITHVVAQLHDPVGSSATARQWARAQAAPACP